MQTQNCRVLNLFGRDFLAMTERQQQYWVEQARAYWRTQGFPYPSLTKAEREREFAMLCSVDPNSVFQRGVIKHSTVGLRLANAFHPQMWHVRVHGRSPAEVFSDDERLRRALRKAATFWPDRRCWNDQCLRSVLRIMHRQRVSNFRPTVSKALLDRYSGPHEPVMDFSAGYGGRLLGALSLNVNYTGIDPSRDQIRGLKRMARTIKMNSSVQTSVIQGCAETILPSLAGRSYSVIFSSPPYFNCEKYSDEDTQSYVKYSVYEVWVRQFLTVVLTESFRLLDNGGYLILNVANTGRFPVASDAERICVSHFGSPTKVLRMLMTTTPADPHRPSGSIYRWEPIFVFQKKK